MITRDDIIRMAREAGVYEDQDEDGVRFLALPETTWERFAALVAEREREACAKLCETMYDELLPDKDVAALKQRHGFIFNDCAAAIRSRSTKGSN